MLIFNEINNIIFILCYNWIKFKFHKKGIELWLTLNIFIYVHNFVIIHVLTSGVKAGE